MNSCLNDPMSNGKCVPGPCFQVAYKDHVLMLDGYERYALYAIINSLSSKMLRWVFSRVRHEAGV